MVGRGAGHTHTGACTRHAGLAHTGHTHTGGRLLGWRTDVHRSFSFRGGLEILPDEIVGLEGVRATREAGRWGAGSAPQVVHGLRVWGVRGAARSELAGLTG